MRNRIKRRTARMRVIAPHMLADLAVVMIIAWLLLLVIGYIHG